MSEFIWRRNFVKGVFTPAGSGILPDINVPDSEPDGFVLEAINFYPTIRGSLKTRAGVEAYIPSRHPSTWTNPYNGILIAMKYFTTPDSQELSLATVKTPADAPIFTPTTQYNAMDFTPWTLNSYVDSGLKASGIAATIIADPIEPGSFLIMNHAVSKYGYPGWTGPDQDCYYLVRAHITPAGIIPWPSRELTVTRITGTGQVSPGIYIFSARYVHKGATTLIGEESPLGPEHIEIVADPSNVDGFTFKINGVPGAVKYPPFNLFYVGIFVRTDLNIREYRFVKDVDLVSMSPTNPIQITVTAYELQNALSSSPIVPPDNVDIDKPIYAVCKHEGAIFVVTSDGICRYTNPGEFLTFPSANWFHIASYPEEVMALVSFNDGLIAFTQQAAYRISGSIATGFTVEKLADNAGILGVQAWIEHERWIYWQSRPDIYRTNGVTVERISDPIRDWLKVRDTYWDDFKRHRCVPVYLPSEESIIWGYDPNAYDSTEKAIAYKPSTGAIWIHEGSFRVLGSLVSAQAEHILVLAETYGAKTWCARQRLPDATGLIQRTDNLTAEVSSLAQVRLTMIPHSETEYDILGGLLDVRCIGMSQTGPAPSPPPSFAIYSVPPLYTNLLYPSPDTYAYRLVTERYNVENSGFLKTNSALAIITAPQNADTEIFGIALEVQPKRRKA